MSSVDYIITAKHYSEREGCGGSVRARILKKREMMHKKQNIALQVVGIDAPSGTPVQARIWQGQWIADCECGGAEFVEPTEPIFYCFSCGNRENNNRVRSVTFPENYTEIEAAVLVRPVNDAKGLTDLERAGLARAGIVAVVDGAEYPLVRAWSPTETLDDLLAQNKAMDGVTVEKGKVLMVVIQSEPEPQVEPEIITEEAGGNEEVINVI